MNEQEYIICSRCIMDTTVSDIIFDERGICNYCTDYYKLRSNLIYNEKTKAEALNKILLEVKKEGRDKGYDCILGVSGGLDSSYALYNAVKLGLRPLAVHLDNGWNSELSVYNIKELVKRLDVDLYTYVIDWEEFRDLQNAFLKASVIDIEMLTDNAIKAALYKIAIEKKIKYIFAGTNFVNEGMRMPANWGHMILDKEYIMEIYRKFGSGRKLSTYPAIGLFQYLKYRFAYRIRWISFLNYLHYDINKAIQVLAEEIGYRPYEKKHYESIFTRFYQGYILPKKFNVDKRKVHYSNLICSGQMTREDALVLMAKDTYDDWCALNEDKVYVLKKLSISEDEFEQYLKAPSLAYVFYSPSLLLFNKLAMLRKLMKKYNLV